MDYDKALKTILLKPAATPTQIYNSCAAISERSKSPEQAMAILHTIAALKGANPLIVQEMRAYYYEYNDTGKKHGSKT